MSLHSYIYLPTQPSTRQTRHATTLAPTRECGSQACRAQPTRLGLTFFSVGSDHKRCPRQEWRRCSTVTVESPISRDQSPEPHMSTTHTAVRSESEYSQPTTDADATITPETRPIRALVCPIEGQLLGMHHKADDGQLECPRCDSRWLLTEVLV